MNPSTSDDKSKAFLEEPLPKDPQENDNNLSEDSQSSDDDENIKADLLQHPLFQHEKDDTLSWLIRVLKPLLEPNPNFEGLQGKIERFSSLLFRAIFENKKISDLKKLFGQFDTLTKTVCGEQIVSGTFYFRCLDCERGDNPEMVSAVCPDCFDRANHDGHRVIFVDVSDDEEEDEGFCDCGDPEMLNPAGFCSFHRSVELNPNEVLQNFPQAQVKKCQSVLGKAIYGVISVFEIAKKISNKYTYENILIVAWGFLDQVFQCLENGYKNISGSFIFIIASILQAQFPAPFNKFWHDCDNFTTFETQLNGLSECKCTVLGNLLRFSSLYPDDSQLSLQSLLMACMKVSKFKDFAAVEYIKYCKVMFPQAFGKKSKTFPETSKLTSVNRAFISPETTTLKMAESGYIIHYPQIIKGLVSKYNNMNSKIQKTLQSLEGIISAIVNPKYRSSTGRIIEKTSFMRDLLEAMTIFQKKFLYKGELSLGMDITKVKFDLINEIADSEKNITSGFENGLRYISQCPHEEKVKYIKEIIPEWIEHYNYLKEYRSTEAKKDHIEISLALERTFCYIIQAYNKVISKENLEEFFKTFLPEVKIDVFAREILERVVKQLGLMRCLVQNDITAEEKLINGYYYPINLLFEIDVVLIQMMTLLVNPDDLFQSLTNNYFSRNKSLRNFCKGEEFTGKEGEKV